MAGVPVPEPVLTEIKKDLYWHGSVTSLPKGDIESRTAKWTDTGKMFLAESKVDLEAAYLLSKHEGGGLARRRLFLLQQSLEKCVKSILPELGLSLMNVPFLSATRLFDIGSPPSRALETLWRRGSPMFYALERPKELTHNPAERLDVASFLGDCFLFALAIDNAEYAAACLTGLRLIESQDLQGTLSEIEAKPGSFAEIESNVNKLGTTDVKNPRSVSPAQAKGILLLLTPRQYIL